MLTSLKQRPAFSVLETLVALGLLSFALMLTVQLGAWSLMERASISRRQEANEAVANVLEAARAMPWNQLTPEWASGRQLADFASKRLDGCSLHVRIDLDSPRMKRVTVEIHWLPESTPAMKPVQLVALLADRESRAPGAKQ